MNNIVKLASLGLFFIGSLGAMEGPIKKIALPKSVKLNQDGFFADLESVKAFFMRTTHEIGISKPVSVKAMTKEAQASKYGTAQLFEVKCEDGKSYILKEIKDSKEAKEQIERLERVRNSKRLDSYISSMGTEGLCINVPLAYVSYSEKGKDHILVIMRKAKGLLLLDLLEQFKKSPHENIYAKAYYDLGAALARFYRAHGSLDKTIVHGHLHACNIFYQEDTLVTLIDNERFAKSFDSKTSVSVDMGYLFITSLFRMEWAHSGFLKDFDAKKWYSIVIPSFILGFIRTYPKGQRVDCFKTLKELIFKWDSKVNKDDSRHLRGLIKEQVLLLEQQLGAEGKTALHIAARYSALSPILKRMLFVEKTKAVRDKDKNGNRALHEAAYFGNLTNVVLLLKADSSVVGARNAKGETPIFKARFNRDRDTSRYNCVIEEFKKHGAY